MSQNKVLTDASVFELQALQVLTPSSLDQLVANVTQSLLSNSPLTLRAGGTSLGGQAIGSGTIVDVSKYLNNIIDYRPELKEIVVEPGVIQDDLNDFVKADGLKFAPDTSTSNRAMIGGMIGNNSCGSYSVLYGTTREHVKSVDVILSDGSEVTFADLSAKALQEKLKLQTLEGEIYRFVVDLLNRAGEQILEAFPHSSIKRRNTGYALDELYCHHQPFNPLGKPFNLTPLICGSEGTLCVIKQATLNLVDMPKHRKLICAHYDSVEAALEQVPELLAFNPAAIELIDKTTLDSTKGNLQQQKNRFWINGDPGAVLVIELFDEETDCLNERIASQLAWLQSSDRSSSAYAAPVVDSKEAAKVWAIRKAGLGLLMGKVTRQKAVAIVEDAAIPVDKLPDYYRDVEALMAELQIGCVYYGHASVGLIHVRPELDLATDKGRELFQIIGSRVSSLVKSYRGALSGEHGDGRIRAPYLPEQFGREVYGYLVALKQVFDPNNLLNPGVIIGDASVIENLRSDRKGQQVFKTGFDWQDQISLLDAVEKCNGAGACRKSVGSGVMCPSYQVTRDDHYSTRGRSNLLRVALTENDPLKALSSAELQDALELCLSCKACRSECPASVDMAKLKAEVLYQTNKHNGSLSRLSIKHYGRLLALGAQWPNLFNRVQNLPLVKSLMGVDARRTLPLVHHFDLKKWWLQQSLLLEKQSDTKPQQTVWLLCDLFSQRQEPEVGKAALSCLHKLGYQIKPIYMKHSPRALISQGLLDEAKSALLGMLNQLSTLKEGDLVVGIEPSELLVWRDEVKSLLKQTNYSEQGGVTPLVDWLQQSKPVLSFEELFLKLSQDQALPDLKAISQQATQKVWLHVHCHQKSLAQANDSKIALELIPNLDIEVIPTGCCGMSGDFGYKHFDISKKIAEQVLLPSLEKSQENDLIVATGTSCRSQIKDLAQKPSLHIVQLLDQAL
ncbi:MAG: hypothetical protein ISEC1_P1641 [Thiomicrorhabdus sp.]|nr:MAG: hypothetical protein ISEC1_P1641 [Thiomicrorhabdus sp.]